jgi:thymidine kinase
MAFNKVSGIVGGAGSGKTTELLRIAKQYLAKGMKVLIYDDFDHPSYRHVPTITISQFPYWKSGMYRIIHPDVNEVYKAINDNVWNALIVFEDCFKL